MDVTGQKTATAAVATAAGGSDQEKKKWRNRNSRQRKKNRRRLSLQHSEEGGVKFSAAGAPTRSAPSDQTSPSIHVGAREAGGVKSSAAGAPTRSAPSDQTSPSVHVEGGVKSRAAGAPSRFAPGKNSWFRVELLVGHQASRVMALPFSQVLIGNGDLSIDSYVVPEGQPFALRVEIKDSRFRYTSYGGRVYIDQSPTCNCDLGLSDPHICTGKNVDIR